MILKGFIPPNTKKNTVWAMSCVVFENGEVSARNRKSAEEDKWQCPEDLLENPVSKNWISCFVAEVQNKRKKLTPQGQFIRFSQDYKSTCEES